MHNAQWSRPFAGTLINKRKQKDRLYEQIFFRNDHGRKHYILVTVKLCQRRPQIANISSAWKNLLQHRFCWRFSDGKRPGCILNVYENAHQQWFIAITNLEKAHQQWFIAFTNLRMSRNNVISVWNWNKHHSLAERCRTRLSVAPVTCISPSPCSSGRRLFPLRKIYAYAASHTFLNWPRERILRSFLLFGGRTVNEA